MDQCPSWGTLEMLPFSENILEKEKKGEEERRGEDGTGQDRTGENCRIPSTSLLQLST